MRHAADFLALPLDVFLEEAYRHVLGRPPDAAGAAHYQRAMLRGALTRMEVLGRLRFSGEGRKKGTELPGLAAAFLLATLYRIPVAGPFCALGARILRLAPYCQDRAAIESAANASGAWMKR
jgi:O-antigen chain-terminating methyltransferase